MQPVTLKNLRESNGYRTMWAPITVFDKNKKQKCQGIIITENQICIINIDNQKPKYILGTSTDKDVEKFIQDNSLWHEVIR